MNIDIAADMNSFRNSHPERAACCTFDTTLGRVANQKDSSKTFNKKVTKDGDVIDIMLDLENKKVCCKVNDEDIGKSIDNLKDGKYRLVVSMWFDQTELELL